MSNTSTTVQILTVTVVNPTTVSLTYSTGTNAPANNNGNVAEVEGQGPASITYLSAASGWTVCGFTAGSIPSDMTIQTVGSSVVIQDAATDTVQETLDFCLQVKDATGNVYTGQDPTIINEPK